MSADFQTHIIQSVNGIFSSMAHGLARHIRGIEWAALRAALLYILRKRKIVLTYPELI